MNVSEAAATLRAALSYKATPLRLGKLALAAVDVLEDAARQGEASKDTAHAGDTSQRGASLGDREVRGQNLSGAQSPEGGDVRGGKQR